MISPKLLKHIHVLRRHYQEYMCYCNVENVRSGFSATGHQTGYSNKPKSEMIVVTGHPTSPIRISHSDLYLSGIYVV